MEEVNLREAMLSIHSVLAEMNRRFPYDDVFFVNVKDRYIPHFKQLFNESNNHLERQIDSFLMHSCRMFKRFVNIKRETTEQEKNMIRSYGQLIDAMRPVLAIDDQSMGQFVTSLVNNLIKTKDEITEQTKHESIQQYIFMKMVRDVKSVRGNTAQSVITEVERQLDKMVMTEIRIISVLFSYFEHFYSVYMKPRV